MPLYDFTCGGGHQFEMFVPLTEEAQPSCPSCGRQARKLLSAPMLLGRARTGLSKNEMPQTWKGTYSADPGYLAQLRKDWSARQRLEAKYPELAGDQRPVVAHEGRYHDAPLRLGDSEVGQTPASSHGHGHGHAHGHTPAHGHGHADGTAG